MKAYFDNVRKDVPENIHDIFLEKEGTAVITIDMHEGHLSTDPDCPCPSPFECCFPPVKASVSESPPDSDSRGLSSSFLSLLRLLISQRRSVLLYHLFRGVPYMPGYRLRFPQLHMDCGNWLFQWLQP